MTRIVVLAPFNGHDLGHSVEGKLAGAVGGMFFDAGNAGIAGHIDDRPTATFAHAFCYDLGNKNGRPQIDVQSGIPVFDIQIEEGFQEA